MRAAVLILLAAVGLTGCEMTIDRQGRVEVTSGFATVDQRMARCMEYASEGTCERQIWGGGP